MRCTLHRGLLGAALLGLIALAAVAATALRYNLEPEAEWKYKTTTQAEGVLTLAGPLGAQPIPVSIKSVDTRSLKVIDAAEEDGWFNLETRQIDGTYEGTISGQPLGAGAQSLPPINYKLKMNELGDVKDLEMLPAEGEAAANNIDLQLNQLAALAQLTGFPEEDLEAGDSWTKEIELQGAEGEKLVATIENKLIGLSDTQATIESTYDMPLPPTDGVLRMGMDLPIRIEGKAAGTNLMVWNTTEQCLETVSSDSTIDIKLYITGMLAEPAVGKFAVTSSGERITE
ncbi:MAG TPA: hypothetical protein DCZ72_13150 [Armatimonadetes bacterium]|nr:hypothetical protein [Armatimonadota bacterium]